MHRPLTSMYVCVCVCMMKLKCDLVSMLLVVTNGRTAIPVEKIRNKKKDPRRGASYGHSNA